MLVRALFFILILVVIIFSLVNINNKKVEDFTDTSKLHFEGSVHLSGNIQINNIPNKIRTKQLCFRKTVDGEVKEECLDTGQFSFALNNSPERNYFKCLGEVCIDNKHLDIIKNKKNFKIKNIGQDKCYTMRDVSVHGLGGNYAELTRTDLNSLAPGIDGIKKLRGVFDGSRNAGYGYIYNEHMPGKLHDDDGDYWRIAMYTDGGARNAPWIPNFLVAEDCKLETNSTFKKYRNIQQKNQFRFIKTNIEGQEPERIQSRDTPVPAPSGEFSGPMPGVGIRVEPSD